MLEHVLCWYIWQDLQPSKCHAGLGLGCALGECQVQSRATCHFMNVIHSDNRKSRKDGGIVMH